MKGMGFEKISVDQYITPTFESEMAALPKKTHRRVQKAIETLKRDPKNNKRELDIKKVREIDALRIKIDDYRVLYQNDKGAQVFFSVLPREIVYDKLGIRDEDLYGRVDDVKLETGKTQRNPIDLPHELSKDLLKAWRIPEEYHCILSACANEDELLDADVPYPVFSRVVDLLYSKKWSERLSQPQYELSRPMDLEDLVEGRLTTRLLRLDDHQRNISSLNIEEPSVPIVIKGGPGSGKSTVALYRAKLLAERYPDAKIAYTTYTKALVKASKEQLKVILPEDYMQIEVSTVDRLALKYLKSVENLSLTIIGSSDVLTQAIFDEILANKPAQLKKYSTKYIVDEIFNVIEIAGIEKEDEYLNFPRIGRKSPLSKAVRKQIWCVYEAFIEEIRKRKVITWSEMRKKTFNLLKEGKISAPYDFLIVDEAQDLSPITIQMLAKMVKMPGGLYITADANQTLYESSFSWDALQDDWPQAEIYALKRNYRNTVQIVRAIADIREALNLQDEDSMLFEGLQNGPKPKKVFVNKGCEIDVLIELLKGACRESHEPQNNVAILVAGEKDQAAQEGERLAQELKLKDVKANYMSSQKLRLDAHCVKILTMHTSKGLEFPIVFLWNVNEGIIPRDVSSLPSEEQIEEELKDRRLFYVGCSRAMRHLAIFTQEDSESSLIYDLQDENWESLNFV